MKTIEKLMLILRTIVNPFDKLLLMIEERIRVTSYNYGHKHILFMENYNHIVRELYLLRSLPFLPYTYKHKIGELLTMCTNNIIKVREVHGSDYLVRAEYKKTNSGLTISQIRGSAKDTYKGNTYAL